MDKAYDLSEQILKARLLSKIAGGLLTKRRREFRGKQARKLALLFDIRYLLCNSK
jgi:hypothetical protein